MRITLLGTGSADGWPNPFCTCRSCAGQRDAGRSRAPSSALIDDAVLVDPGPTAAHAASRLGVALDSVEHVLVTHGHPDHLDPAFLLARAWSGATSTLHVWAPPHALDLCRDWVGPDAPVVLHAIAAGDVLTLDTGRGQYRARALAASHAHGDGDRLAVEALLFEVTGPDGTRLLYATDTGPLPATTVAQVSGVDVVLIDATFGDHLEHGTGHLDLGTLPTVLDGLRTSGVLREGTRVLATHLSHHNPPEPELAGRLAAIGIELPDDGDVIDTTAGIDSPAPIARPRPVRHLITGGARSGKSRHAEAVAATLGVPVAYVATGGNRPDDAEWTARIAAHRSRRPATWTTVETADPVPTLRDAAPGTVVLVDCLTLWLTATMDAHDAWRRCEDGDTAALTDEIHAALADLVDAIGDSPAHVLLVTNEVGWGVVPSSASVRLFRDLMGRVNQAVAGACTHATLVVAGRALPLPDPQPLMESP